ncbi:MAG: exonuclease SbcCD subunit D [Chloroflexi bacterium]|nr:MAG: exonuclease SbcCD subunit D [Chloroflexota bacterium]
MKILHFADLHLGMENYGRMDGATGLHSRLADFLRSFDELVDFAIAQPVDLVLFAGDAYRTRDPSPTQQREFAARVRRLRAAGIPVFMLVGNHDLPNAAGRANSIEIFETLAVEGVTIARLPAIHRMETAHGPVQIVALPWVLRSVILSRDEYKNLSLDELNQVMANKVSDLIEFFIEQLDPAIPAVLAAHGTVQGAVYGSERSVMLGADLILPRSLMAHPAFAYTALGHVHKHQVLAEKPPVVYAGSLDRIDFGEEKDEKGFILVELCGPDASWQFVPVQARPFITIRADATSDEPTMDLIAAIQAHNITNAVVRLIIRTTTEKAGLLRDSDIRNALKPAWHVASISKEVQQTDRVRLGAQAGVEGLTPVEALARYFAEKRVAPERSKALLERAESLIRDS